MTAKRKVEFFSAGCDLCEESLKEVRQAACPSCEIVVLDVRSMDVAKRAHALGIRRVPAVVIDGQLASCCAGSGLDLDVLRAAGLGLSA